MTHRGVSRSVHIITGHTAAGGLPEGAEHLAALEGTLVFLMGLSHLEQITESLLAEGKPPDPPAAVTSGGNAAHPMTVRATLDTIARRAREADVRPPAVIVVGGTAALDLSGTVEKPLAGVRVGLTGTDEMARRLRSALEPLGANTRQVERAEVQELPTELDFTELFRDRRWLVFTSVNGVETFFRRLGRERVDLRRMSGCRFAVIGAATGAALERHGILPDLCPSVYTSEALAAVLTERGAGDVVLLRSKEGTPQLPALLRGHGIPVRDIPIYTVRTDMETAETAKEILETLDYLAFSSAGGVERYFTAHGAIPEKTVCVCIGSVTAEALRARYEKPFLTAASISAVGMAETILKHRNLSRGNMRKE